MLERKYQLDFLNKNIKRKKVGERDKYQRKKVKMPIFGERKQS